ncbi:MAG: LysR substrate-binding domain-containing protein, partial [Pseudomonadota bacterium]
LRIFDGPHAYLIERLRLGTLDLVVGRLGEPDTMQGISFTQLYTEEVAFVVRAGHPLLGAPDLRALPDWPVLYPPPGAAIRPLVERLLIATGVGPLPNRIETVSGGFGRAYTRGSDAVWIISGGVVAREVADGTLMRLPFETALTAGPVGLMTRPDLPASPLHRMFERAVARAVSGGAT